MFLEQLLVIVFASYSFELPWYKTYWLSVVAHTILAIPFILMFNDLTYYNSNNDMLIKLINFNVVLKCLMVIAVMIAVGYLVIFILRYFMKMKKIYHIPKWCWIFINSMLAIHLLSTQRSYHQHEPEAEQGIANADKMDELLILICIIIIVLYITNNYADRKLLKVENNLLKKQNEIQYANYLAMQQQELQIHKLYHDIGNHIKTIQTLVKNGETLKAKEYTLDLEQQYRALRKDFFCNNKIINAVLSQKAKICEQSNITYDAEINIKEELPFSDIDLMCVYSNLLDNAIEGCQRNECSDNYIQVKSIIVGDYLAIKIINSKPEEKSTTKEQQKAMTWKKDKGMHGYGLRIIEEIVERYDGQKEFNMNGREYSAMVMLKMSS
jgi:hypothetical protein